MTEKFIALWYVEEIAREEYKKILEHRRNCPKWQKKELCLECFGGGLTKFWENIIEKLK